MLSSNCVALPTVAVKRESGAADCFIAEGAKSWLYEFKASCVDFSWGPDDAGWEDANPVPPYLITYCHQNGQSGVQTWYAFKSQAYKMLFLSIIEVEKVGPSTALKILSKNGSQVILDLIAAGDKAAFIKLPGVGAKTGEAIAKVLFKDAPAQPETVKLVLDAAAVAAMRTLGYDALPAKEAVKQAMENTPGADTSALVTEALRLMRK
jgi:Holliday junction resolvasome RuvABC DNA-binding subunit